MTLGRAAQEAQRRGHDPAILSVRLANRPVFCKFTRLRPWFGMFKLRAFGDWHLWWSASDTPCEVAW